MQDRPNELESVEELYRVIDESERKPALIFKHSLTCPISARAFSELQSFLDKGARVDCYTIIVQTARAVSNEAADRLQVVHQSPQALLVADRRVIWNASHFDITASSLESAVSQV